MVELIIKKPKAKIPDADYVLEKSEQLLVLLQVLTPKFVGVWEVILIDPKVVFIKECEEKHLIPDWMRCRMLLTQQKIDMVCAEYPKLYPNAVPAKQRFLELISTMTHPIEDKAMWMVYRTIGANFEMLQETLDQLDAECKEEIITAKQVQSTINYQRRVYASDVIADFLLHRRYRWQHLNTLVSDLGESYAYNALYKQAKTLLQEKEAYLQNKDYKNKLVEKVDAPFICYVFTLFSNSKSYRNLYAIFYSIDNRSQDCLERIRYASL